MGFLSYLVYIGVFRKIKINFLLVGHTHEVCSCTIEDIFWFTSAVFGICLDSFPYARIPRSTEIETSTVSSWTYLFGRISIRSSAR